MSTLGFRHNTVGKGAKPVVKRMDNSAESAGPESTKPVSETTGLAENQDGEISPFSFDERNLHIQETDVSGSEKGTEAEGGSSVNLNAVVIGEIKEEVLNELRRELRGTFREELREELLLTLREEIAEELKRERDGNEHSR